MKTTIEEAANIIRNLRYDREIWDQVVNYLRQFLGSEGIKPVKALEMVDYGVVPEERIRCAVAIIQEELIGPAEEQMKALNKTEVEVDYEQEKTEAAEKPANQPRKKKAIRVSRKPRLPAN